MVGPVLIAFFLLSFLAHVILPLNAWAYCRLVYPLWHRRIPGEPAFPVNLIVPCKGTTGHLADNLRAKHDPGGRGSQE